MFLRKAVLSSGYRDLSDYAFRAGDEFRAGGIGAQLLAGPRTGGDERGGRGQKDLWLSNPARLQLQRRSAAAGIVVRRVLIPKRSNFSWHDLSLRRNAFVRTRHAPPVI